jgi:hypothetical protein
MKKGGVITLFLLLFFMLNSLLLTTTLGYPSLVLQQDRTIKVLAITNPGEENEIEFEENEFSSNFAAYGDTKINIDRTTASYPEIITTQLLNESQADVLYLHNLASRVLSVDEQDAIMGYLSDGHGIVGTHETLKPAHASLAAPFGINPEMISNGGMSTFPTSTTMILSDISHPLLVNMPSQYHVIATMTAAINGQPSPWSDDLRILMPNGNLLVTSTDGNVAIIYSEVNSSVYLTNNPADSGSPDDMTLLYNSMSWSSLVSNPTTDVSTSEPTSTQTTSNENEPNENPFLQIGNWFIGLILVVAIVGGILVWANQQRGMPQRIADTKIPDKLQTKEVVEKVDPSKTGIRHCTACGAKNDLQDMFCGYCGKKF